MTDKPKYPTVGEITKELEGVHTTLGGGEVTRKPKLIDFYKVAKEIALSVPDKLTEKERDDLRDRIERELNMAYNNGWRRRGASENTEPFIGFDRKR